MTIFKLSKLIRVKILENNQNHLIYFFIWKQASIALMINHLLIFSFICRKQLSHLAHIIATINMGRSFLPSPTPHPPRPNSLSLSLSISLLSLTHTNTLQCVFFFFWSRERTEEHHGTGGVPCVDVHTSGICVFVVESCVRNNMVLLVNAETDKENNGETRSAWP